MSAPSDTDAYSYAKFLVDIYPEDAIEILCKRGSCDVIELVTRQVERNCIRLAGLGAERGISKNRIMGMVLDSRWDDLKALRGSPTTSATTTPRHYRHTGDRPPTPSSTVSGSPQTQRNPNYEWIIIHGIEETHKVAASPSGSEEYLIGEDKLKRFPGETVNWTTLPQKITVGGKMIDVSKSVGLTWNRPGEKGTSHDLFWVVRPEFIRHSDVLLGSGKQRSRDGHDKGLSRSNPLVYSCFRLMVVYGNIADEIIAHLASPLVLHPSGVPPEVPMAPQLLGRFEQSTSSSIHSVHDSPNHGFRQGPSHTAPSRLPLRKPGKTATMNSGPPSVPHNPQQSHYSTIMERESSRPGSASSNRTTKSSKQDNALVQLSFEGKGKKLLLLDLTMHGDKMIPYIEPHISKLSGKQLDRSMHEMKITPLRESNIEPLESPLAEDGFEYIWGAMVHFMGQNRAGLGSQGPEFLLDIG
ncbi:hypothetical protein V8E51_011028 [Hyaloscypha variabilis]